MNNELPRTLTLTKLVYAYLSQTLMPEETMVSLPVLDRRDGRLVAHFFGTVTLPTPDATNLLVYRPPITVTVDWDDERVIEHRLSADRRPVETDTPLGVLHPAEFSGTFTPELDERMGDAYAELYDLFDVMAPLYGRTDLSADEEDVRRRCNAAYQRLLTADVREVYVNLGAAFFRWLEGSREDACPNCGTRNPPQARFCTQCGTRLQS